MSVTNECHPKVMRDTAWLAARLGISITTIERMRVREPHNLPPHLVIGQKLIRYDEEKVEDWIVKRLQGDLLTDVATPVTHEVNEVPLTQSTVIKFKELSHE